MKTTGYVLLLAGFLLGAYSTALDVESVAWTLFVPGAVAALAGVLVIRRGARGLARAEHVLTANRAELESSLGRIVSTLEELDAGSGKLGSAELRQAIDDRLRDDLRRFADARETMVHLYGIQAYADIMSEFASGERYVNRVWSAAADGYAAEAADYLGRALAKFRDTRERFQRAAAPTAGV